MPLDKNVQILASGVKNSVKPLDTIAVHVDAASDGHPLELGPVEKDLVGRVAWESGHDHLDHVVVVGPDIIGSDSEKVPPTLVIIAHKLGKVVNLVKANFLGK